jgi:hypothetical protein
MPQSFSATLKQPLENGSRFIWMIILMLFVVPARGEDQFGNTPSSSTRFWTFEDYGQFYHTFYFGYELINADTSFDGGSPRVGFMSGMKYGEFVPREISGWRPFTYGVFHYFTAGLTNSAEQDIFGSSVPSPGASTTEKAFEFETHLFWPLARTHFQNVQSHFGLLASAGGKKTKKPHVDARFYGGLRVAKNHEFYTDFLVGKTQGLNSLRTEIRGELPVHKINDDSDILLGAIGNFGLTSDKNESRDSAGILLKRAEEDVVRVYVIWNVDFKGIFKK